VTQSIGTAHAVNTYFVWLVGTSCRIARLCSKVGLVCMVILMLNYDMMFCVSCRYRVQNCRVA